MYVCACVPSYRPPTKVSSAKSSIFTFSRKFYPSKVSRYTVHCKQVVEHSHGLGSPNGNCSETSRIHEEGKRWSCHNYWTRKGKNKEQYMNHCTQRHFERGSRDYGDIGHFGCVQHSHETLKMSPIREVSLLG